jgi:hypothetical protein
MVEILYIYKIQDTLQLHDVLDRTDSRSCNTVGIPAVLYSTMYMTGETGRPCGGLTYLTQETTNCEKKIHEKGD